MNSDSCINKVTVLDSCVDGDEALFNNLIGKNYDGFIAIYDTIRQNKSIVTGEVKCTQLDDIFKVSIPVVESDISKVKLPSFNMSSEIIGGHLTLNINIKKEW